MSASPPPCFFLRFSVFSPCAVCHWLLVIYIQVPFLPGSTMELDRPGLIRTVTMMAPMCPHFEGHPLFLQQIEFLHQRITEAVVREITLIVQANQGNEPDQPPDANLSQHQPAEVKEVEEDVEDGEAQPRQRNHSDGCVTAAEDKSDPSGEDEEVQDCSDEPPTEAEFIRGIRRSSSPRPESSCSNRAQDVHMEAASASTSTKEMDATIQVVVDNPLDSSDSSDLPSFTFPDLNAVNRSPSPVAPPIFPIGSQDLPINISSSASSVMSSASRLVSPRNRVYPPFPPPLADVSMSEIESNSSVSSDSVQTLGSRRDEIIAARALVLLSQQRGRSWGIRRLQRESRLRRARMRRVANWLVASNNRHDHDIDSCPGCPGNPIVVDDDSDED